MAQLPMSTSPKMSSLRILLALDYLPATSLQLDNRSRSDLEGHKMMAQCAAHFARQFLGVIEIGDAARGSNIQSGKRFDMNEQGGIEGSLVDADFMDEWAQHPDFGLQV